VVSITQARWSMRRLILEKSSSIKNVISNKTNTILSVFIVLLLAVLLL
jgi:hypothetical protein